MCTFTHPNVQLDYGRHAVTSGEGPMETKCAETEINLLSHNEGLIGREESPQMET